MPGFRSLWRGGRERDSRENGRKADANERPERDPGRGDQGGEDFRYRPESGRHRYPEGLYSGIGRASARDATALDGEPGFATRHPRHNGHAHPPSPPLRRREERRREDWARQEHGFQRPDDERPRAAPADYDVDADDRDPRDELPPVPSESRTSDLPSGELPVGPHRGKGPRGYRRSDERIREDVCDRLTENPEIDATDIEVLVADSEVTLNGSVETRLIRRLAEDLADTVPGVRLVQNNLRIGPSGESPARDEPLTADPTLAEPGVARRGRT